MDPYETLGVPENADAATIKHAYRKKARETHPDANNGEASEEFLAVQKAYDILNDPRRRSEYDQFGTTDDNAMPKLAEKELTNLFLQLIDNVDVDHSNIVEMARDAVSNSQRDFKQKVEATKKRISKLANAKRRLRHKKMNNPVAFALKAKTTALRNDLKVLRFNIQIGEEMHKLLADYEYEFDQETYTWGTMKLTGSPFKFPGS